MPIRFQCPRCRQPIEVDDQLAGKLARCPYCQTVVNVPAESALPERPVPPARPAADGVAGGLPPLPNHLAATAAARRWERFALICAGLVAGLLIATWAKSAFILNEIAQSRGFSTSSQPTMQQYWEMTEPLQRAFANDSVVSGLLLGMAFFGLAGTVAAVVALRHGGRWRAWVAIAVCAPVLACNCCGVLTAFKALLGA